MELLGAAIQLWREFSNKAIRVSLFVTIVSAAVAGLLKTEIVELEAPALQKADDFAVLVAVIAALVFILALGAFWYDRRQASKSRTRQAEEVLELLKGHTDTSKLLFLSFLFVRKQNFGEWAPEGGIRGESGYLTRDVKAIKELGLLEPQPDQEADWFHYYQTPEDYWNNREKLRPLLQKDLEPKFGSLQTSADVRNKCISLGYNDE